MLFSVEIVTVVVAIIRCVVSTEGMTSDKGLQVSLLLFLTNIEANIGKFYLCTKVQLVVPIMLTSYQRLLLPVLALCAVCFLMTTTRIPDPTPHRNRKQTLREWVESPSVNHFLYARSRWILFHRTHTSVRIR
jgi:hypothetical protein